MVIQMDEALWEFSKAFRKKYVVENLDIELSAEVAAIAFLRTMEVYGLAVQNIRPDGIVIWKATPKFLDRFSPETGPLVTLRSTLN